MIEIAAHSELPAQTRLELGEFFEQRLAYYSDYRGPRFRVGRESKECPPAIQELVTRAGGRNLYGRPNFRVVWGWSRLTLIGGQWTDWVAEEQKLREVIEYRWEPKYLPFDRWHVEKWMSPEFFGSPEQWRLITREVIDGREIEALGPYPARGDYEHCFTIADADGSYLPLTPSVVEKVVAAVEASRHLIAADRKAALERREDKKEKDWDGEADAILDDALPAFAGAPSVLVTKETP